MSALDPVPYSCPDCGVASKKFRSLRDLKAHLRISHQYQQTSKPWSRTSSEPFGLSMTGQRSSAATQWTSGRMSPITEKYSKEAKKLEQQLIRAKENEQKNRLKRDSLLLNRSVPSYLPSFNLSEKGLLEDPISSPKSAVSEDSKSLQRQYLDALNYSVQDELLSPYARQDPVLSPKSGLNLTSNISSSPQSSYDQTGVLEGLKQELDVRDFKLEQAKKDLQNLSLRFSSTFSNEVQLQAEQENLIKRLEEQLRYKDHKLERADHELESLTLERRKLQQETLDWSRQNEAITECVESLHDRIKEKEKQLDEKEKEIADIKNFLATASEKEMAAREELENLIDTVIDRADKAEHELTSIKKGSPLQRSASVVGTRSGQLAISPVKRSASACHARPQHHVSFNEQRLPENRNNIPILKNTSPNGRFPKEMTSYQAKPLRNPGQQSSPYEKPYSRPLAHSSPEQGHLLAAPKPAYAHQNQMVGTPKPVYAVQHLPQPEYINPAEHVQHYLLTSPSPAAHQSTDPKYPPTHGSTDSGIGENGAPHGLPMDEQGVIWNDVPPYNMNNYQPVDVPQYNMNTYQPPSNAFFINDPGSYPVEADGSFSSEYASSGYDQYSDDFDKKPLTTSLARHPSLISNQSQTLKDLNKQAEQALKQQQAELMKQLKMIQKQREELQRMEEQDVDGQDDENDEVSVTSLTEHSVTEVDTDQESVHVDPNTSVKRVYSDRSQPGLNTVSSPVKRTSPNDVKNTKHNGHHHHHTTTPDKLRRRRRDALFCVFMYLDTRTLGRLSEVCREWRHVSRHPALWKNVKLEHGRISSKYLLTISKWCTQTQSLTLEKLRPRARKKHEGKEEYIEKMRGSLEPGFEALLKASRDSLLSLRIDNCWYLLTERSLWHVSCHCAHLHKLAYISATDPLGPEVIWALGSGCKQLTTLVVPPLYPNAQPNKFTNLCVQKIGECWPHLKVLCLGGIEVNADGLVLLAQYCLRLQVLELDHMCEINEETAVSMCKAGLKGLKILEFTFTPVTPKALFHFNSACPQIKSISVHIGISDYFEDTDNPQNQQEYQQIVGKLTSLMKRPGFAGVLTVKSDYG